VRLLRVPQVRVRSLDANLGDPPTAMRHTARPIICADEGVRATQSNTM